MDSLEMQVIIKQLGRVEGRIQEDLSEIAKRFDKLEEKWDTYQSELMQVKTDVSWIKGSGKIAVTFVVTAIGAIVTAFIKIVPAFK